MSDQKNTIEIGFTMRLLDDLEYCVKGLATDGPEEQFWRRTAYRTLFGYLEAWMSVNRRHMVPDLLRDHIDTILTTEEDVRYAQAIIKATAPTEWVLNEKG